eukprot:scaffold8447_cov186-Amphora_coffeaeformis.AAC.3
MNTAKSCTLAWTSVVRTNTPNPARTRVSHIGTLPDPILPVPQTLYDDFEERQVARIKETRAYLQHEIWINGPNMCSNKVEQCSYYAVVGECERSSEFMAENCAPMCRMCQLNQCDQYQPLSVPPVVGPNCPVDYSSNVWAPGDLDKMFERIVSDPAMQVYEPKVLSRPTLAPGDSEKTANYIVGGPWIVVFDNMATEEETDRLIELGKIQGYKRSLDAVGFNPDGSAAQFVSPQRTSTNAWCMNECATDPKVKVVSDRMSKITGIPESYAADLQLLHYTEGQFCTYSFALLVRFLVDKQPLTFLLFLDKLHHDYIQAQEARPAGPRILTFYIYLNDMEEGAGGGTNFPYVDNLTVQPKKGRAVLWPSVLNEDVNAEDFRTMHEALAVKKGDKFGANAWIHLRDMKNNYKKGCF